VTDNSVTNQAVARFPLLGRRRHVSSVLFIETSVDPFRPYGNAITASPSPAADFPVGRDAHPDAVSPSTIGF